MTTQDEIAKAKAKIAKLMNMTVENGCSEDEQETAMQMAAGIAMKLGIELDAVKPAGEAKRKIERRYKPMPLKMHQFMAGQAAAVLYGVEWNTHDYGKNGFEFIGREELVEIAEQTMFWLMRQVELLYKQNLPRGMTQRDRAEYRRTFKEACALRVLGRAEALIRDVVRNDASAQSTTGSNALVVAGHFKQLREEINDYWDERLRIGKYAPPKTLEQLALIAQAETAAQQLEEDYISGKKKRPKVKPIKYRMPRGRTIREGNGTAAGHAAGDTVKLRKEVQ